MSIPKSVTKVITKSGKSEVTFTSSVDRVNYTMKELIRGANRDVGKVITTLIARKVIAISPGFFMRTKSGKRNYRPLRYQYWCRKKENDLQIGVENIKHGAISAWWADQSELGTHGQPMRGFIRETVEENIGTIREIQSKYLSALSDEIEAEKLAAEAEAIKDEPQQPEEE